MVLVLTAVAALSGLGLAAMSQVTAEPIRLARQADLRASLTRILPAHANEPSEDRQLCQASAPSVAATCAALPADNPAPPAPDGGEQQHLARYVARDAAGNPVGAAFEVSSRKGYGGLIRILVGVDAAQRITGFAVLEHKETPGLGDKAAKDDPDSDGDFADQFKGQGLDNFRFAVVKDGGQVDAITSATITSRAVSGALDEGLKRYQRLVGQEGSR